MAARVDLDSAVARVDLDAVVGRVDLDAAAAALDVDRLVTTVDLDAVPARTDPNPLVIRMDLDVAIAREVIAAIDLPEIVRDSAGPRLSDVVAPSARRACSPATRRRVSSTQMSARHPVRGLPARASVVIGQSRPAIRARCVGPLGGDVRQASSDGFCAAVRASISTVPSTATSTAATASR